MTHTIDDIITALDTIIAGCEATDCTLGYFAILYRRVTRRVKAGILAGEFEDGIRMERLVVVFANRYLEAYTQYQQKQPVSASWQVAFEAGQGNDYIIMQHLLLGINAHINLDLGIAAVAVTDQAPLDSIQRDFNDINRVLSELTDVVKMQIGNISVVFKWLMPLAKNMDEKLVQFSIHTARDGAWRFAQQLSLQTDDHALIAQRDQEIAALGYCLVHPNRRLQWLLNIIAWCEWGTVTRKLQVLEA